MTIKNNTYDPAMALRQAAYIDRLKSKGLKQTRVWAHPEDVPKIREYAKDLASKREK